MNILSVQLVSAQKRTENTDHIKIRIKARLHQFQSCHQRHQAVVSRFQSEISALVARLVEDKNHLVAQKEHSNDLMFKGLARTRMDAGCQADVDFYEEPTFDYS